MTISGSRILLTGASSGIGAALAGELDRRGARLALVSRTLAARPGHNAIPADLMQPGNAASAARDATARLGAVDILIHCAGAGLYARSWNTPPAQLHAMFALNFFAAAELVQSLVPDMIARRSGYIVLFSSIAGAVPLPWLPFYSSSKAALDSWARSLRSELYGSGVGVLSVAPGYVRTPFQSNLLFGAPPARLAHIERFASTPQAVARAVADGMEQRRSRIVMPPIGRALALAACLFPRFADARLRAIMEEAENDPTAAID